jgi:hypothetical protein
VRHLGQCFPDLSGRGLLDCFDGWVAPIDDVFRDLQDAAPKPIHDQCGGATGRIEDAVALRGHQYLPFLLLPLLLHGHYRKSNETRVVHAGVAFRQGLLESP